MNTIPSDTPYGTPILIGRAQRLATYIEHVPPSGMSERIKVRIGKSKRIRTVSTYNVRIK